MYNIIKRVISSKRYDLSDILKKIDTLWVQGNISDEQKTELVSMARGNANANDSMDLYAMFEELEERVRVLEEKNNANSGNSAEPDAPKPHVHEYKPNKKYRNGDRVSFEGKIYICVVPDKEKCVWSPAEYPDYWEQLL